MPLYFAYGANMDIADMAKRAPNSRPLGLARLPCHRFIIMKEGYASVVRDPRRAVYGLLWDLALTDLRPLDKFEGVDRGLYTKIDQPVVVDGGAKRALVYVGRSVESGRPNAGYLEGVIAAAQELGLPAIYLGELNRWLQGGVTKADEKPAGPVAGVRPTHSTPLERRERPKPDWEWKG